MADYNSVNRERKKQKLKANIIRPEDHTTASADRAGRQEEEKGELAKKGKRVRKKGKLLFFLTVAVLIGGTLMFQYQKHRRYTSYTVTWEKPMEQGSIVGYAMFGENVIKYTHDGATYYDAKGKPVWNEPFGMKSPVVAVNGEFAAVADQGGNSIYIFNQSGRQGIATTILPITRVTISAHGMVAAVLEDSLATYIRYYKPDGNDMDLWVKSVLSGDGYPMALSLSEDGGQLLCAFSYLGGGGLKSRAVFYNFSIVGQNVQNRMAGAFAEDPFAESMIAQVQFLKDPYSCAVAHDSLTFFTSKNLMSPAVVNHIKVEEMIQSVFYSKEYVGIVVKTDSGADDYRMDVYRADGGKVFSESFTYAYKHAEIDGDQVLLYNEDSCRIYNMTGVEVFHGSFDFTLSAIRKGKFPGTYLVTGPDVMKEIKLQ